MNALRAAMNPSTVLQMIAVDDIGKYGARVFTGASALNGREIDLAGDAVAMPQAARILSRGLGRTIEFMHVPIEEVRKNSEDMAFMLEWFDRVGYDADIEGLEREFGIKPAKLVEWAGASGASLVRSTLHGPGFLRQMPGLRILAEAGAARFLREKKDPSRPMPAETFEGQRTPRVWSATIEVRKGRWHSPEGDLFIYLADKGL